VNIKAKIIPLKRTSTSLSKAEEEPCSRSPSVSQLSRIAELDGFRALAVLGVLFCHSVYGFRNAPAAVETIPAPVRFALTNGWRGVDVFFVLSGFLITGILLDAKGRQNFFKNFYGRRALRILPLYLTVLVVCAFFYVGYSAYFWLSLSMLANFAHVFRTPTPHGPGVFWSLAVEEHFYLIWPLLVARLDRRQLTILATAIVVLTPVLRLLAAIVGLDVEASIYPISFFRFDGLATGGLLALWVRSRWHQPRLSMRLSCGIFLSVVLVSLLGIPFGLMGTKTLAAAALRYTQVQLVVAAAMLAALCLIGSPWTVFLRSLPARITADYSYCIYLVHLSLGDGYVWFLRLKGIDAVRLWGPMGSIGVRTLFIVLASYSLAALSYHFLEQPFLRLKRYF